MPHRFRSIVIVFGVLVAMLLPSLAHATPVCTDGYKGGPPLALCGGRIFPEAAVARSYIQYHADPAGFREYQHGIEYLAQKYPRWVSVFSFRDKYGDDAVSAGLDRVRSYVENDANDGKDIWVVKITDHSVPDDDKEALLFSLSVHGNERGGLEGGLRTAEDLAVAADRGAANLPGSYISDGVPGYQSTTGTAPEFHSYRVDQVLKKQAVYLVDYNIDGWAVGDLYARNASGNPTTNLYSRGNSLGTDLNRQMPTVGRINPSRNPLQESEMYFGHKMMQELVEQSGGPIAHGADIHGELTSRAYVDIMYPAGEFDSVEHRRLMSIAERVKSVVDETLFAGIQNEVEEAMGGDGHEGIEETVPGAPKNSIPTKPAHWATVWDTLGYTDTGFIGDYLATDIAVTGMDYEIFLNHTVPDKVWNVYLQENHINMVRAAIKTSMAYALTQEKEFNDETVRIDTLGRAGYIFNPDTVTDSDENGVGTGPASEGDVIGLDPNPVTQKPYEVSNMKWFEDTNRLMDQPFVKVNAADIAADAGALDGLDTLVLADTTLPDASVDRTAYFANLKAWVGKGGNLVLTDRALHALGDLGLVDAAAIQDVKVYQPYANIRNYDHPMVAGLRKNARQLVEAPALGYGIGNSASPMTVVNKAAWEAAGGATVGTTGPGSGNSDDQTLTSIGEMAHGDGKVRIIGGALPTPTEENDHRYGLRNYALTYSGLFVMENSIKHDSPALGTEASGAGYAFVGIALGLMLLVALALRFDVRGLVRIKH